MLESYRIYNFYLKELSDKFRTIILKSQLVEELIENSTLNTTECLGVEVLTFRDGISIDRQLEILKGLESASFNENDDTELVLGTTCGK